ncbi:alpha/beta hydrolase [Granulibacter bethesdensis]|uniref:Acetyl esterase n=1 Tax=Granulibacter bethesdensis (strain ATCC BAA-1260 / CGDNIH1) TaxID=391165 RepID=Q0BPI6_GRABC|nr:alpha/beta hydrolase [Granulibacter bethesdensis]ABI63266.1 Acetyl esterase [Granulibacter bethesdensis CGDNIH1]AHJ69574.1 Acetyl esterase [Granulibacter bethesdensis]APH53148.1 Acetyl esterase [Granulibacter bethesdensis]APH65837.1 Acetyl esterase [Granulibacter bethesdensis]
MTDLSPDPQSLLQPEAAGFLARMQQLDRPGLHTMPPEQARAIYDRGQLHLNPDPPPIAECRDLSCPVEGGEITLRLYRNAPPRSEGDPVFVFFHGGGWVLGTLDTHDVPCRQIAIAAGITVISVGYRLAPEHKFPTAVNDAITACTWIAHNAAMLGIDPARIAVGGDSAGGNLAAVLCLTARDQPILPHPIRQQILLYPSTDMRGRQASHTVFGQGFGLTSDAMRYFLTHYLSSPHDIRDWRASPLLAPRHDALPAALIITSGCDPLRDEGEDYAIKLREAGVPVSMQRLEGQIHGFLTIGRYLSAAGETVAMIADFLRRL